MKMFFLCLMQTNKFYNFKAEQRCRDGVMKEFVSWCKHLLVSSLFHAVISLHPPSLVIEIIIPLTINMGPIEHKKRKQKTKINKEQLDEQMMC